jgi:hypothetical protein
MWFLRPSAPATILQSYDQNASNTIRKTGTKHWPQTLFQHLGGVDSLQLYHSTGRFTARIRPARLLTKSYEARPITTTEERK